MSLYFKSNTIKISKKDDISTIRFCALLLFFFLFVCLFNEGVGEHYITLNKETPIYVYGKKKSFNTQENNIVDYYFIFFKEKRDTTLYEDDYTYNYNLLKVDKTSFDSYHNEQGKKYIAHANAKYIRMGNYTYTSSLSWVIILILISFGTISLLFFES